MSKAAVLGSPVTLILRFPAHLVFFLFDDRLAPSDATGFISEGLSLTKPCVLTNTLCRGAWAKAAFPDSFYFIKVVSKSFAHCLICSLAKGLCTRSWGLLMSMVTLFCPFFRGRPTHWTFDPDCCCIDDTDESLDA